MIKSTLTINKIMSILKNSKNNKRMRVIIVKTMNQKWFDKIHLKNAISNKMKSKIIK